MRNKDILDYLKFERENLLYIIGDNKNEFNDGRVYAMDKMIDAVEGIFFNSEDENVTQNAFQRMRKIIQKEMKEQGLSYEDVIKSLKE